MAAVARETPDGIAWLVSAMRRGNEWWVNEVIRLGVEVTRRPTHGLRVFDGWESFDHPRGSPQSAELRKI